MVLKRENDGKLRCDEGAVSNSDDDVSEENVGAHGLAVSYDGLLVLAPAVPAVQLHTAAAGQQGLVTQASVIVGGAGWCTWRYISTQDLPPNCLPDR